VSAVGGLTAIGGLIVAVVLAFRRLVLNDTRIQGWTSVVVLVLLIGGAILFSLGIIAEYVGAAVRMSMGKPLYLITTDPSTGPLMRDATEETQETLGAQVGQETQKTQATLETQVGQVGQEVAVD
jgi:undecaprenyl-phosphate 4-deoxy-4-formamido-L-arabinose transferase